SGTGGRRPGTWLPGRPPRRAGRAADPGPTGAGRAFAGSTAARLRDVLRVAGRQPLGASAADHDLRAGAHPSTVAGGGGRRLRRPGDGPERGAGLLRVVRPAGAAIDAARSIG